MRVVWRLTILMLCVMVLGISTTLAQDEATDEPTAEVMQEAAPEATAEATPAPTTLAVDGSLSMAGLMQTLVESYQADSGTDFALEIRTNGPNAAFEAFCKGELGLVMATRSITDAEEKACADNGVEFIENLVAYQGLVFLLSPTVQTTLTCVSLLDMESVFGLGGEGTTFDVQKFSPEDAATELAVYIPHSDSAGYEILRSLLPGGEVRTDATVYETPTSLIDTLTGGTADGIAAMSFAEYSSLPDLKGVKILQVRNATTGDCIDPSLTTMEVGTYDAFRPQMLYVSMNARQDTAIRDFLTFINNVETGAFQVAGEAGYTAASEPSYARNENNLLIPTTGRTFSRPTSPVVVSTAETGTVNFGGTALGARVINELTGSFTSEFTSATVNRSFYGTEAAFEALCAGDADVILVDREPTEDELAACAEQNIELVDAFIGTEALVFLVRADQTDLPACISVEELALAFGSPIEATEENPNAEGREIPTGPTTWNQLNESYPEMPLLVFVPGASTLETDWLFAVAGQNTEFARSDQEENVFYPPAGTSDPNLYNAASVANVEGGLTVAYWSEYQASERQTELRPLAVGENCVVPDETTIADGTYPFAASYRLYFSKANMGQPIVGAFMWSLISENTLERISDLNLAVSNVDALRTQRDTFFELIQEAQELAAQQAAETTAEATAEVESTAEAESTAEPTAEATAEAESTAEATAESTAEATAEATETSN